MENLVEILAAHIYCHNDPEVGMQSVTVTVDFGGLWFDRDDVLFVRNTLAEAFGQILDGKVKVSFQYGEAND